VAKYRIKTNTPVGSVIAWAGTEYPSPEATALGLTEEVMLFLVEKDCAIVIKTEKEKKIEEEEKKIEEEGINISHLDAPQNFPARSLTAIRAEGTRMKKAEEEKMEDAKEEEKKEDVIAETKENEEKVETKKQTTKKKAGRPKKSGSKK
jgi:ribosomal protein L9